MLTVVSLLESKCQRVTRKGTEDQRSFKKEFQVAHLRQKEGKLDKSCFSGVTPAKRKLDTLNSGYSCREDSV